MFPRTSLTLELVTIQVLDRMSPIPNRHLSTTKSHWLVPCVKRTVSTNSSFQQGGTLVGNTDEQQPHGSGRFEACVVTSEPPPVRGLPVYSSRISSPIVTSQCSIFFSTNERQYFLRPTRMCLECIICKLPEVNTSPSSHRVPKTYT